MVIKKALRENLELLDKCVSIAERAISLDKEFENIALQIIDIQARVNKMLFSTEYFSMISYSKDEIKLVMGDRAGFLDSVGIWRDFILEIEAMMDQKDISLDASFYAIMSYFSVSDAACLLNDMKKNLEGQEKKNMQLAINFYNSLPHLWGKIEGKKENYEVLESRIKSLKEHENDFIWLYERLGDNRSKTVLLSVLKNWINFSLEELQRANDLNFDEYCDFDLLKCGPQEVFVDCGGFDGDTVTRFIESYRYYKKIYCYEASPSNFKKLEENTRDFPNIDLRQRAVGETFDSMTISDDEEGSSLYKAGDVSVDVVPLDEDIKEPITLVKMDIEGAEKGAILGMKGHIENEKPRLVICVYHGNRDIVEIPLLVDSIRDDYKFYLRYKGPMFLDVPVDMALYAM